MNYEIDCMYLSRLQRAHAGTELFIDSCIMILVTVMYTRTGLEKSKIRQCSLLRFKMNAYTFVSL
jgi:hypothetical protein